ncbi:MAG: hypothetical protein H6Q33_3035 [Deltaproteobacteria bacterium]|nr:hypothetical protein [Deltaproteobacteria bacterium]
MNELRLLQKTAGRVQSNPRDKRRARQGRATPLLFVLTLVTLLSGTAAADDTPTPSPTDTASPTETATMSPTVTATASSTLPPTSTPTHTPTPTATPTPVPDPQFGYWFVTDDKTDYSCAFDLFRFELNPAVRNTTATFAQTLADDPMRLRNIYRAIYVYPVLNSTQYDELRQLVKPGGVIEQFVDAGGVAVINAAGTAGDQANIAPDGVGITASQNNAETIAQDATSHPYITGLGTGGFPLSAADFDNWAPTDGGIVDPVPSGATRVLQNSAGPTWVEYRHGEGKVIVTTLTYCSVPDYTTLTASQQNATANLLFYGVFFSGAAFTPAPTTTVTSTPVATQTPTRTRTPRPTSTPTVTSTPTTTATPTPACPGDCTRNGLVTVDEILVSVTIALGNNPVDACLPVDANHDGQITIEEILLAINVALNGCPSAPGG